MLFSVSNCSTLKSRRRAYRSLKNSFRFLLPSKKQKSQGQKRPTTHPLCHYFLTSKSHDIRSRPVPQGIPTGTTTLFSNAALVSSFVLTTLPLSYTHTRFFYFSFVGKKRRRFFSDRIMHRVFAVDRCRCVYDRSMRV